MEKIDTIINIDLIIVFFSDELSYSLFIKEKYNQHYQLTGN